MPVRRRAFRYNQVYILAVGARRHGLRIACGCVPRRERSLRRSSSPKKVTPRLCCSLVNALATRRLATNFFRYQAVGCCAFSLVGNAHLVGAMTAKLRPALRRVTSARLSCSSSPKKVSPRLCCSLINALATRRLATNFFRYQAVRYCAFLQVENV